VNRWWGQGVFRVRPVSERQIQVNKMADTRRKNIIVACVVCGQILRTILNILKLSDSESSDEINRIIEKANFVEAQIRFGNRGYHKVREQVYVNEIIPRFSDEVFRQHFRITRTTYENLEQRLTPALTKTEKEGRPMIPVRIQLLSVIWLLATPDSFR